MEHIYTTQGTCSKQIQFEVQDGKVHNVSFVKGCNGNLKSIGRLVEGRPVEEIVELLEGVTCGARPTSCGDQLAKALKETMSA